MPNFNYHLTNNPNQKISYYRASNMNNLLWYEDWGIGYLKPSNKEQIYNKSYWDNYMKLRETGMGKALTKARIELTKKYATPDNTIDIGIGNGQFVDEFGCMGADINPFAVDWLKAHGKFSTIDDDYGYNWWTMWDVIEHIEPDEFCKMVPSNGEGIILSTPIYTSFEHCISSKHFKPEEHLLYFTTFGIINYMEWFGYKCIEISTIESKLGRDSIGSFVFKKI